MTASVILGACLPQKPPASTARPNPYPQRNRSAKPWNRLAGARGRSAQPASFPLRRPFTASVRPDHHGFAERLPRSGDRHAL